MRHLRTFRYVDEVAKVGSIRGAAETLSITPSALNRRVLALEEELGAQIFERIARGVRLSPAGEILIKHIRAQVSEMERVRSEIDELSGVSRGHISVACSQALLPYFLANQMELFRRGHPGVTFTVLVRDREAAEHALCHYFADVAIIFEPVRLAECRTLLTIEQPVHAIMSRRHPLAKQKRLRLKDCLEYPLALPSPRYGVRSIMEQAATRLHVKLNPAIESDSFDFLRNVAANTRVISFQIKIGLPQKQIHNDMVYRPVNPEDVPPGSLHLAQLRERFLPVASARFAEQLMSELTKAYPNTHRKFTNKLADT